MKAMQPDMLVRWENPTSTDIRLCLSIHAATLANDLSNGTTRGRDAVQ
jgi:hypothetical protein